MAKLNILFLFVFYSLIITSSLFAQDKEQTEISDTDKSRAKDHFLRGQARFEAGEFSLAVEHFRISYDITAVPDILYNIAMCYENDKEVQMALEYYRLYLRMDPDAKDRADIENRIKWIEDTTGKKEEFDPEKDKDADDEEDSYQSEDWDGKDEPKKKRLKKFALELAMGPGFMITMPKTNMAQKLNRHNFFSADILADFYTNEWFAITAILVIAGYIEKDIAFVSQDAEKHVGLGAGISMDKLLSRKKASLCTRLLAIPTAVSRAKTPDRATWINFQISVGLKINLPKKWHIIADIVGNIGPVVVVSPDVFGDWQSSLYSSAGGRLGVAHTF